MRVADIDETATSAPDDEEEDEGLKPLSDRLVMELTAHRTPGIAQCAGPGPAGRLPRALHAMVCGSSTAYAVDSCIEIEPRNAGFRIAVAGPWRHGLCAWPSPAPRDLGAEPAKGLRGPLGGADRVRQLQPRGAFAHCVAMSVNCRPRPLPAPASARIAHADVLHGTVRP